MFKDFYSVALCPKKYQDSPQPLRERIRKNEAIIYEREVQSKRVTIIIGWEIVWIHS